MSDSSYMSEPGGEFATPLPIQHSPSATLGSSPSNTSSSRAGQENQPAFNFAPPPLPTTRVLASFSPFLSPLQLNLISLAVCQQSAGPSVASLKDLLQQLEAEKAALDSEYLEVLGERDLLLNKVRALENLPPSPSKRESFIARTSEIQRQLQNEVKRFYTRPQCMDVLLTILQVEQLEKEIESLRSRLNTGLQAPATLKSGFLEKQSEHLRRFRLRYVVLTTAGLFSFHSQEQAVDLDSASVRLLFHSNPVSVTVVPNSQGLSFCVKRGKHDLIMRCESEKSCSEWIKAIREASGNVEIKGGGLRGVESMVVRDSPLNVSVEFVIRKGQEGGFRADFLEPLRRLEKDGFVQQIIVQERRGSLVE